MSSSSISLLFIIFPHQVLVHTEIPHERSFFQAERSQLSQPVWEMLQSFNHICSPVLDSHKQVHGLLLLGSPELGSALEMCTHIYQQEGKNHLTGMIMQLGTFFASRVYCWLLLLSPRTLRPLLGKLLSSWWAPRMYRCLRMCVEPPCVQSPAFLELHGFPVSHPLACPGSSKRWHNYLVYHLLLPVLYPLWTFWGCYLSRCPGHQWGYWTSLGP